MKLMGAAEALFSRLSAECGRRREAALQRNPSPSHGFAVGPSLSLRERCSVEPQRLEGAALAPDLDRPVVALQRPGVELARAADLALREDFWSDVRSVRGET
jgi:hypothetical protein